MYPHCSTNSGGSIVEHLFLDVVVIVHIEILVSYGITRAVF